jgi:uncharacterized membrane protein
MELTVLSRWIHIGTVIVLIGGTFFLRFILAPAASQLSESESAKLKDLVMNKWKKFVHAGIGLLILSGFYNYIVGLKLHAAHKSTYHMLVDTKILLFFASALVGRSKSFEGMRKQSKTWQLVILVLAAIIIGISGYVKVMLPPSN